MGSNCSDRVSRAGKAGRATTASAGARVRKDNTSPSMVSINAKSGCRCRKTE
jgi:hypothetical protein